MLHRQAELSKAADTSRRGFLTQLSGCFILGAFVNHPLSAATTYQDRLYTPTQIAKLFGTYFIVDCWHHRILYSKKITTRLSDWNVLDDNLAGPHSIASNGSIYVADNTGRHALNIYRPSSDNKFELIQTVPNIGRRPHRVLYDFPNKQFLVVGSMDQSIHICIEKDGKLMVVFQREVTQLEKQYCRSITIKDDVLYFVGSNDILMFELKRHALGEMIRKIKLNEKYTGSNDLFFLDDSAGLLTSTPKTIVSFKSLSDLERGTAADLSLLFRGTPYYIERFDNKVWIPEINEHSAINFSNSLDSNSLKIEKLFDFGPPHQSSLIRKSVLPL